MCIVWRELGVPKEDLNPRQDMLVTVWPPEVTIDSGPRFTHL